MGDVDDLVKSTVSRRRMKRLAAVAGGLGLIAGGAAWQRKHPRGPGGKFRDTPDKPTGKTPDPATPKPSDRPPAKTSGPVIPPMNPKDFQALYPHVDLRRLRETKHGDSLSLSENEGDTIRGAFHHWALKFPDTAKRVEYLETNAQLPVVAGAFMHADNTWKSPKSRRSAGDNVRFGVLFNPEQLHAGLRMKSEEAFLPFAALRVDHTHVSRLEIVTFHELGHLIDGHGAAHRSTVDKPSSLEPNAVLRYPLGDVRRTFERTRLPFSAPPPGATWYGLTDTAELFAENFSVWMSQSVAHDPKFLPVSPDFERWMDKQRSDIDSWERRFRKVRPSTRRAVMAGDRERLRQLKRDGWVQICGGLLEHR
jgi:hypothetical protein